MHGEHVDRLDLVPERIMKPLGDGHSRESAADLGSDRGVLERTGTQVLAVRAGGIQAAFRDFAVSLREENRRGEERECGDKQGMAMDHGRIC